MATKHDNIPPEKARALENSQRIIDEAFEAAKVGSKKYSKELKKRKYLANTLKFVSLLSAIFITAGYIPHQLAIAIAVIYGIDTALSNSKRLVTIAQAEKAYEAIEKKMVRTHQTEQAEIFKIADQVELVEKQTDLNILLTKNAHKEFETVETAINNSDIETLQALSLDEEKLNIAMKQCKHP